MQKQEACKILGVKENASRIEIEKRYATILRKYRSGNVDADDTGNVGNNTSNIGERISDDDFDNITQAYNLLMGYVYQVKDAEENQKKPNLLLQKLGINEEKLKNNLYYFRTHIIVGIIILITVIFSVRGCVNRVDPDLYVVFMGEIYCNETEQLEADIKAGIPEIEAVGFENILISKTQEKQDPQVQMAMLQKAGVLMAVGEVDVFILDQLNFEKFAKQGAFVKLDELVLELNIKEDRICTEKIEEEDREGNKKIADEGIYGIDIKDSKILSDAKTVGKEKIAAISIRSKHYDKSAEFIKLLIELSNSTS